jgi:hypothetical protein
VLEAEAMRLEQPDHERVGVVCRAADALSIDAAKHIDHAEGASLVAVYERMIDPETLEQRCRLRHKIVVVPELRAHQRGLQRTGISKVRAAAMSLPQDSVDEDRLVYGDVNNRLVGHCASRS